MLQDPSSLRLSIVIPAYDEEQRIAATLQRLDSYLSAQSYGSEIVVANDGSRDGTAAIVAAMAQEYPRLRLITIPHAGKGAAVRAGMLAARGAVRYLCDADLSTPPEEIARFLVALEAGAHIAIGSREVAGAQRIAEPWRRHLMGRVFNAIVRVLAVSGVRDTQCGFKAFAAEAAEELFRRQRLLGFGFDVEILALARRIGYSIHEVPVTWYWQSGSKVRALRDTWRMLREVLVVRRGLRQGLYGELPTLPPVDGPALVPRSPRAAASAQSTDARSAAAREHSQARQGRSS